MSNAPNILGGGMFNAPGYNVNQGQFNNGLATAAIPAGNQQIQNYLGATTQNVGPSQYATGAGAGLGQLAGQYQAMANGQGPSAATVAAQQQGAANLAGTESMLGSVRGSGNPAQAQQTALDAQVQGQQQIAANTVAGRTQEELGALGGLGSTYGALGQLGGQQQQLGVQNQQNTLSANTNYLGALTGIAGQQQQGQISGQQLAEQAALQQQAIQNSAYQASAANNNKVFGQVLGASANAASSLFGV